MIKSMLFIAILLSVTQMGNRQKLYSDGLLEARKKHYSISNGYLLKAFTIKPDSHIAFWIANNYANQDSIQQCLFFLDKTINTNPQVLDSVELTNIEALKSWAKERDYETYVKFSLSLSYKSSEKNFPIQYPSSPEQLRYFLKRISTTKDSIPPPTIKIGKNRINSILQ